MLGSRPAPAPGGCNLGAGRRVWPAQRLGKATQAPGGQSRGRRAWTGSPSVSCPLPQGALL